MTETRDNEPAPDPPVVLIVDGDPDSRSILEVVLAHRGYRTLAASTGDAALTLAWTHRPSVIVSELYLAAAGHRCLLHAVRGDGRLRRVPLVAHTAWVFPADEQWAVDARADAYLRKPARPSAVVAHVDRLAGASFRRVDARP